MRYCLIFPFWIFFLQAVHCYGEDNWYCNEGSKLCYMISDTWKNFDEARSYCRTFNSQLTSITSVIENGYIARLCGSQSCWIGLLERTEGDWYWLDGNSSDYRNWSPSEPNNYGGTNEDHTVMNIVIASEELDIVNRRWFDVTEGFDQAAAICKKNMTVTVCEKEVKANETVCEVCEKEVKANETVCEVCEKEVKANQTVCEVCDKEVKVNETVCDGEMKANETVAEHKMNATESAVEKEMKTNEDVSETEVIASDTVAEKDVQVVKEEGIWIPRELQNFIIFLLLPLCFCLCAFYGYYRWRSAIRLRESEERAVILRQHDELIRIHNMHQFAIPPGQNPRNFSHPNDQKSSQQLNLQHVPVNIQAGYSNLNSPKNANQGSTWEEAQPQNPEKQEYNAQHPNILRQVRNFPAVDPRQQEGIPQLLNQQQFSEMQSESKYDDEGVRT